MPLDTLPAPPPAPAPPVRRWAVLAVLCASLFLVGIDLTVLHVAVPTLTQDLLPTSTELLWIVDIYPLTVAALLVTFGTLGDRLGRKRLVLSGFAVFGLASAGVALATGPLQLIITRGLLGLGAAMLMASTVAIIRIVFTDRRERALALGLWTAASSAGAAVGPLVGGLLLEHWWWGSVFLVNLPVAVVAVAAGARVIPESRDESPRRWDAAGAALSVAGLAGVVFAFKRIADQLSLDAVGLTGAVGGGVLLVLFFRRQRRLTDPLVDLSLFADRRFSVATLCILVCFACYTALLFFATQLLQLVVGYSPLRTGLALVPLAAATGVGAVLAPWAAGRWTHHRVTAGALAGFAAGLAGLAAVCARADSPHPAALVTLLMLAGTGAGTVMTLGADTVMSSAREERAGEAGGIQETSFQLGAGLGIALLGTVLTLTYRSALPPASELPALPGPSGDGYAQVRESLGSAAELADRLGPAQGAALLDAARDAFTKGFVVASATAAVALTATAVRCAVVLRERRR